MTDHDSLLKPDINKNSAPIFFDAKYFELLQSQQKLGPFLEDRVLPKSKFSKIVNNEKCATKIIFFYEKKKRLEIFG